MEKSFFTLLRLGLGNSSLDTEDISDLLTANSEQWKTLESFARTQGVSAIVLDGVTTVMDTLGPRCFNHFDDISFWRRFITKWALNVEQGYETRNLKQVSVINDVQHRWEEAGIRMMILKGAAIATYYPIPNHRSPGDIDCYLFDGFAKGNEVAREWAGSVDEGWYKHSQILYCGQLIENHQYFVHTREGRRSKDLEDYLVGTLKDVHFDLLPGTGALMPPPKFNALFLTYHALTHFLVEGMRFKQLVDWAMFLRRDADKIDWTEFYKICDKYHLRRFADVATDVAVNCLGVSLNNPQITVSSPYTAKVIHSTLYDNDYVFSSGDGGWINRWHLLKNLFKYRWKFYQIYQHSLLRHLWFLTTGYLFKTE